MPAMKRHLFHLFLGAAFAAFAAASCSETPTDAAAGASGALALKIGTRAEADAEYDPMQHLDVRIYNDRSGKLLRKYTSAEALPERLELLGGSYRVRVEAGQRVAASFTERFYEGEQPFEVQPAATTPVEVVCRRTNVAAAVAFDATVAENFGQNFRVRIAAADAADERPIAEETVPALTYTADAKGYFLLPEGVTTLAWRFEGDHPARGRIVKEGRLTGLKAGDNCSLAFAFNPDLPGFIECFTLALDPDGEIEDDTMIWPEIVVSGDGFDLEQPQEVIPGSGGAVGYRIANSSPFAAVALRFDGEEFDLLNAAPGSILVERPDELHVNLTLTDAFFAGRAGGSRTATLYVQGTNGSELTRTSTLRVQGMLPVSDGCDLWLNTLTLRALILDPAVGEVHFTLRPDDGDEERLAGVRGEDGIFSATFAPSWTEGLNDAGLTVYTPDTRRGVFPGHSYTCKAVLATGEFTQTFTPVVSQPIPYGDMEDGSLSAYSTSNTAAPCWGSGNNTFTKHLCDWSTFAGMGGEHCTKLAAAKAPIVNLLAAGNFFTGTFTQNGTGGIVAFGQDYDWKARPTGLRFKYHATVGTVDKTKHAGAGVGAGDQDISVVYVGIVDWSARHEVSSSTSGCSGMWLPDDRTATDEGPIIGYGILYLKESTAGDAMVETTLPLYWYDTQARPAGAYKLVISCSTSLYGDYMAGCSTNVLYLDDFEWVY